MLRGRLLEGSFDSRKRALVALRNFGGRGGEGREEEGRWPLFFCRRGSGARPAAGLRVHLPKGTF